MAFVVNKDARVVEGARSFGGMASIAVTLKFQQRYSLYCCKILLQLLVRAIDQAARGIQLLRNITCMSPSVCCDESGRRTSRCLQKHRKQCDSIASAVDSARRAALACSRLRSPLAS